MTQTSNWHVAKRNRRWRLFHGAELISSAKGADGKRMLEAQAEFFNERQIKPLTPEEIEAASEIKPQATTAQ